jgi:cell wall-associated NlpC family hydrolase
VFEFARHIIPGAIAAPGAARDVLSRVNLPIVDGVLSQRGALAGAPAAPGSGAEDDAGASVPGAAQAAAPAGAPAPAPPAAAETPADTEPAPETPADTEPAPETPADTEPAPDEADAAAEPQARAAAVEPPAPRAPVDPGQFGAEGTGGPPGPEALALLDNKNVVLDQDGVNDIKAGRIDPRVVAVLTKLSEDHKITVSCMCSDHPTFTTGGSVSNHHHGRGVDIAAIDGMPVNAANPLAREVATELSALDPSYRPNEIGTPWPISGPGYFTDADHNDHLHVGFKQAIDPAWKPPAEQSAATAAAPQASAPAPVGTMSIAIGEGAAAKASNPSMSLPTPSAAAPAEAQAAGAPAPAGAGAVAEAAADAPAGVQGEAGPKAMAALKEALKYKGTPYLWGGSNPQTGFDCSGLMQWAYAKQGITTGRTTYDQIDHPNGTKVERADLLPGDLVLFRSPDGDVHHVGMSMGGDKFLHAPRTGDVVKISSLDEPYYDAQFTGGRRFDDSAPSSPAAAPAPDAVKAASVAAARDAAAARNPNSMVFKALSRQEASYHRSTVQFMRAITPEQASPQPIAAAAAEHAAVTGSLDYPGDGASKQELAAWLAAHAQKAGLPPELPVMAALVESGVANLKGGHADSVGFFQMRVGIWNKGEYAGYPERPELQAKWFIDHALAHKRARIAAGEADFGKDPATWGNWIADVERPAAQYRGRYQLRLEEARGLLRGKA